LPNLLKNLQLEELSLVDRPANAQAMVSLFKRDDSNKEVSKMTQEEMEAKVKAYMEEKACGRAEAMKALGYDDMMKSEEVEAEAVEATEEAPEVEKADEEAEAPEAEVEKAEEEATEEQREFDFEKFDRLMVENQLLRKSLIENGYVIYADKVEKKSDVEMMEIEGEMVAKSDIPAPVLKALEAAAVEKADVELTKRAEATLPHFDLGVAKELLKFDLGDDVMAALKAADKLFEGTMAEFGKSDVDGEFTSANDKIEALVKSYMEEHNMKKSQYAVAYAAVAKTDEGKALINKSYKGE
jgi:hypothetical protein